MSPKIFREVVFEVGVGEGESDFAVVAVFDGAVAVDKVDVDGGGEGIVGVLKKFVDEMCVVCILVDDGFPESCGGGVFQLLRQFGAFSLEFFEPNECVVVGVHWRVW